MAASLLFLRSASSVPTALIPISLSRIVAGPTLTGIDARRNVALPGRLALPGRRVRWSGAHARRRPFSWHCPLKQVLQHASSGRALGNGPSGPLRNGRRWTLGFALRTLQGNWQLLQRLPVVPDIEGSREQLIRHGRIARAARQVGHHAYRGGHLGQRHRTALNTPRKSVEELLDRFDGDILLLGLGDASDELRASRGRSGLANKLIGILPLQPRRYERAGPLRVRLELLENRCHPTGGYALSEPFECFVEQRMRRKIALGQGYRRSKEFSRLLRPKPSLLGTGRHTAQKVSISSGRLCSVDEGRNRILPHRTLWEEKHNNH